MKVLLTGATGFVGSHLHPVLEANGFTVIGATRHPERARRRFPERTFRHFDTRDESAIARALQDCDAAVYLVHSMADAEDYLHVEETSAQRFLRAAEGQGIERIVYLGGIQPLGEASRHLQSRLHTGEVLRSGKAATLELRASMIIGPGSESFRMVRDLSARLPVMLLPRWLDSRTQPIALDDVTWALTQALKMPLHASAAYALPGPEILTCREILEQTAVLLGRKPRMGGVPFVTPRLSSYWITWVTRADKRVARELVEGLRSDLLAADDGFFGLFPEHQRLSFQEALERALPEEERGLSLRARLFERLAQRLTPPSRKPQPRSST